MAKIDTSTSELLKNNAGSTETLDGFSDELGVAPERKRKLSKTRLVALIFVLVFLVWVVLFLGLTMYQIRSYADEADRRPPKVGVRGKRPQVVKVKAQKILPLAVDTAREKELKWAAGGDPRTKVPVVKKVDTAREKELKWAAGGDPRTKVPVVKKVDTAREKELKRIGGGDPRTLKGKSPEPQPPKPSPKSEEVTRATVSSNRSDEKGARVPEPHPSVMELAALEAKVESFTAPDSFVSAPRYSDVKTEKVAYNCYRKDFIRTNISGSGMNCRFIAKIARIPPGASYNKGRCASSYYWIYNNPQTKRTLVYSMGPYYGDHSVEMREALFDKPDKAGSFTLFGCAPPLGPFTSPANLKDKEYYFMNELATITPGSYKFDSYAKFYKFLDARGRKEMAECSEKIDILKHDEESVSFYTTMKEAASCLNSL